MDINKYRVTSRIGLGTYAFKKALESVPDKTTIDDICIDDESGEFYIEFYEEKTQ